MEEPSNFTGEMFVIDQASSVQLMPGSQDQLEDLNQNGPSINFKNLWVEYCIKLYEQRKETIDRFLIARQKVKLDKRKFSQSTMHYIDLKNLVFEEQDSETDPEDGYIGVKFPRFGSQ